MPTRKRATMTTPTAYQLKVTLDGVRPPIWRRIRVRSDNTLEQFHQILQTVMGWTNSHMHGFRPFARRLGMRRGGLPIEPEEERRTRLADLLRKPKDRILYEYDFGDGWEHEILLEEIDDHAAGTRYPWVLDGRRACPPDDVGGVSGYSRFLHIISDPRHPEHEEMMEWCGGSFDSEAFDVQVLNQEHHGGWAPKKPKG